MTARAQITLVAEDHATPAEGINVVSRTLIDDLRARGAALRIIPPARLLPNLPRMIAQPSDLTVFTHGPGVRTVLASAMLRRLSRSHLVWVATRPDLAQVPRWLRARLTAHTIICNRPRAELASVAPDARVIIQPIGIAPERLAGGVSGKWPVLAAKGVPVAVHVGHLRRSRGLERLSEVKARLGDRIEIVVVASPYFDPDPQVVQELTAAGVHIDRGFVAQMADVYHSADLYLFPAPPEGAGAIELPLSVLEALACSCPVITTRFGALPDALNRVQGVRFADCADFAAAVADWIDAPARLPAPSGLPAQLNAHRLADWIIDLQRGAGCKT